MAKECVAYPTPCIYYNSKASPNILHVIKAIIEESMGLQGDGVITSLIKTKEPFVSGRRQCYLITAAELARGSFQ